MKNLLYFTIMAFALVSCNSQPEESNDVAANLIETDGADVKEAKIEFKETVWDFGNIVDGERVVHTFKFKNVGEGDLLISSCTASCGCTIPEWPKEPIAPGAEGSIKVEFNSAGKSGNVSKDITILSNANPVKSMLQIKVFVAKK
jgi:hypothetical protein